METPSEKTLHPDTIVILTTDASAKSMSPIPVQAPVVANVVAVYGTATASGLTVLAESAMQAEGMTFEQVHEFAMTNLQRKEGELAEGLERKLFEIETGGSVFVLQGQLAATQLLFVDAWSEIAAGLKGDLLASFVGEHTLLYVDAGDPASLEAFEAMRSELTDGSDEASDVLRFTPQAWVAWER